MSQNYTPEFKRKIVRLHEEEGRTYKSIIAEYGVSKASTSKWCSELREECQTSPETKAEFDNMKELLKLEWENEEPHKENLFPKRQRHSLQRKPVSGLSIHRPMPWGVWLTLAAPQAFHISQFLLQLPETPEGRLLYPKIRSHDTGQ